MKGFTIPAVQAALDYIQGVLLVGIEPTSSALGRPLDNPTSQEQAAPHHDRKLAGARSPWEGLKNGRLPD